VTEVLFAGRNLRPQTPDFTAIELKALSFGDGLAIAFNSLFYRRGILLLTERAMILVEKKGKYEKPRPGPGPLPSRKSKTTGKGHRSPRRTTEGRLYDVDLRLA
jgi:hypothetical protein